MAHLPGAQSQTNESSTCLNSGACVIHNAENIPVFRQKANIHILGSFQAVFPDLGCICQDKNNIQYFSNAFISFQAMAKAYKCVLITFISSKLKSSISYASTNVTKHAFTYLFSTHTTDLCNRNYSCTAVNLRAKISFQVRVWNGGQFHDCARFSRPGKAGTTLDHHSQHQKHQSGPDLEGKQKKKNDWNPTTAARSNIKSIQGALRWYCAGSTPPFSIVVF